MSSTYQQEIMSKSQDADCQNSGAHEFPFAGHALESSLDVAHNIHQMPYQESVVSSHSLRQSLQFIQSYREGIPPSEQTLLQHGQYGSIPFSPFPATTPGEVVHPLGLSSTADVPFSLSKQRHHDPRLARRLEMPSEFLPHISSDDVLRLNLPASDLFSALPTNSGEGSCLEQSAISAAKRIDSLQERIDRMQAELDARASPGGYYQSDADTETEYSPLSQFHARGSSSSNSEEDEELVLDIIKLRRPTALGHLEKNTDDEQTNEEGMEVDEGNMADDLVDEIVRMKPLQAKAARETFGEQLTDPLSDSRQENDVGAELVGSTSFTDCLFIDVDSSDAEGSNDDLETDTDDLSVVKSSLLMSLAAKNRDCNAMAAAVVAKPTEVVGNRKDGQLNELSEPVKPVDPSQISEGHSSSKEAPDILSPVLCDIRNDYSKVPVHSVDVASVPRAAEDDDLSSKIVSLDEVVSSKSSTSAAQPETSVAESFQICSEDLRIVKFVETGKLSIEIHSDVQEKSASDETAADVLRLATSAPALDKETGLVIEEDQIASCVAMVLHRDAKRKRPLPMASTKEEDEAEHQMELIWKLGLHYLAFFIDKDDDDNREIDAEEVPSIRSITDRTNTFVSNKSKLVGRSSVAASAAGLSVLSAASKSNHVQQLGVCSSNCTTDIVRPKRRSRSISSNRQDSSYRYNTNSYYDDEYYNRNRTRDYWFRNERFHPYYQRQDNTRARIDRDEFFKVYREHRNLEELLQCLTKSQFESRRTRPILTHLTSNPSESAQSSPRFKGNSFQRSTNDRADEILGRREKVDDCLEDEMFDRDQVPNFYEKKAIADAIDDIFRPATTESPKSQPRSSSVVSKSPKIVKFCGTSIAPRVLANVKH